MPKTRLEKVIAGLNILYEYDKERVLIKTERGEKLFLVAGPQVPTYGMSEDDQEQLHELGWKPTIRRGWSFKLGRV